MDLTKVLMSVVLMSIYVEVVTGCGRLKCYKCNSQDSPSTCGEDNFNADVHKDDTTSGSTLDYTGGTSCVRGWAVNDKGTYYFRDKSNEFEHDGCDTPQKCFCSSDLCNSKASRPVFMATTVTTTLVFSLLGNVLVKKIFV
ncbi:uncharacterized protein LOC132714366 [Ruditapes philippinarum]|uniref:uncharacterized protein LOC132714366 n=1 Tax=Ruditapes philippinarum TaxID=129788 RepID=UPI00295B773E|nr:uncharacterized protein LOC132714366 [Ruditapes philippinarum]